MKLSINQPAPFFRTNDVYGNEIDLRKLKGQKIYLAFERNAGCPVCNLRTHQLLKKADAFAANNVTVVMVYESPVNVMREYLGENNYPFHFVSDPQNVFYNLYGVEGSFLKLMKGMFHGLLAKVSAGTKLFAKPIKQDGHMATIPAEFIIDEQGRLKLAHYGRFLGDHVPVEQLLEILKNEKSVVTNANGVAIS